MKNETKENQSLRILGNKRDIKIYTAFKKIQILRNKTWNKKTGRYERNPKKHFDLGNKSWGRIDYMVHYQGYTVLFVNEF